MLLSKYQYQTLIMDDYDLKGDISKSFMNLESLIMIIDGEKIVGYTIGVDLDGDEGLVFMDAYDIHKAIDSSEDIIFCIKSDYPKIYDDYLKMKEIENKETERINGIISEYERERLQKEEEEKALYLELKKKYGDI